MKSEMEMAAGLGVMVLALVSLGLWLALVKARTLAGKLIASSLVLGAAVVFVGPRAYQGQQDMKRVAQAQAHFVERCKAAGQTIYRTVQAVDGIQLWGTRTGELARERANQHWPAAGMPKAATDMAYIDEFLMGAAAAFDFVDLRIDEQSFTHYRLNDERIGPVDPYFTSEIIRRSAARYLVDYRDISTAEDRSHWVAGGHVRVLDAETGELFGEMRAFAFDPGLGSLNGARQAWGSARTCEATEAERRQSVKVFIEQVIKRSQGA